MRWPCLGHVLGISYEHIFLGPRAGGLRRAGADASIWPPGELAGGRVAAKGLETGVNGSGSARPGMDWVRLCEGS